MKKYTWEQYKGSHHPLLEAFLMIAPYMNSLYSEDISIGVADTKKYLISTEGETIKLNIDYGVPLQEGDAITEAIRKKQAVRMIVPEKVFGFPMIATGIPLFGDKGEVIGGIGLGVNMAQYNILYSVASNLLTSVQEVTFALNNLAESTGVLAVNMEEISKQSVDVLKNIEAIEQFSDSVKNISSRSQILGINAAIEASRVGDLGRGFAVVADEIRKMALNSNVNATQIQETVEKINHLIKKLDTSISEVNRSAENQSSVTEELSATMQTINEHAKTLNELAERALNGKVIK